MKKVLSSGIAVAFALGFSTIAFGQTATTDTTGTTSTTTTTTTHMKMHHAKTEGSMKEGTKAEEKKETKAEEKKEEKTMAKASHHRRHHMKKE